MLVVIQILGDSEGEVEHHDDAGLTKPWTEIKTFCLQLAISGFNV